MDLRAQLALNLGALMLGGSIVMVRRYGLDVREAWALRKPPNIAWLAVIIGAPAGMIVAQGVFVLSSHVLPVPSEALETFSESLTPDIPAWQLYPLLTLAPGVCEEIFFRGMLLHGLRKRLGPVALCLVVGLVFGLFHVALFRLIPTGFIGVMLAAVTLLTGSIFPAMLWHAGNNLCAVLVGEAGYAASDTPGWLYAVASVVLAAAFWLLWKYRSPYPDLRRAE
jgi:membrane protease YdiL (CAAX protease family)